MRNLALLLLVAVLVPVGTARAEFVQDVGSPLSTGAAPYNVATAAPGDRGYNGGRWRVEVVDYAVDYASALAAFDGNGSGDFDSAAEVESAIEAGAITTSDGPSFVCPVIPLPH